MRRGCANLESSTCVNGRSRVPLALLAAILIAMSAPALAQPLPTVSITDTHPEVPIGETSSFVVKFSNTGNQPGYGPYLALCLPAPGADRDTQGGPCDGISFASASAVFTGQSIPLPPANTGLIHSPPGPPIVCSGLAEGATNPLCRAQFPLPAGFEGCQVVLVELPFGSFYPDQPEVTVEIKVKAHPFADAGTNLPIRVVGGFRFGADPTGGACVEGTAAVGDKLPSLFTVGKTYLGPEGETATGPNFPRRYRIDANVADGQTLDPLRVTEKLPDDLVYLGPYSPPVVSAPPLGTAGGTVVLDFGKVTGGPSDSDASFTFKFYAGNKDARGGSVLDPATCEGLAVDDVSGGAFWRPLDPRDAPGLVVSDVTPEDHRLRLKCVAVQKSVAGPKPVVPSSTLTYTLDLQVSDYVRAGKVVVTDVLADGLRFLAQPSPTLRVVDEKGTVKGPFVPGLDARIDVSAKKHCGDGRTVLRFDVSKALARLSTGPFHKAGLITGGEVPPNPPSRAATVRISYRARVQDRFDCPVPTGDPSVDKDDVLINHATVRAETTGLSGRRKTPAIDDSAARVEIAGGTVLKNIVARNGNTADAVLQEDPPRFGPGDTVTFRLRYRFPSSDAEHFVLEDFLPSPVFNVGTVSFVSCAGGQMPAANTACWGPGDQVGAFLGPGRPVPCRGGSEFADPARNSVCFDLGSFDDPKNKPRSVEILFTVRLTGDPFVDGLQLTNEVFESERNSFGEEFSQSGIRQLSLGQPVVRVSKGAVATCCAGSGASCQPAGRLSPPMAGPVGFGRPGSSCAFRFTPTLTSTGLVATPVNSDAVGSFEPGDQVLFALVVENTGSSPNGAFDIRVRDILPNGMRIPAGGPAVCVADGAGQLLPFKDLGGLLFGAGLELVDPGSGKGALARGSPANAQGTNVAVITYVLEVGPSLSIGACTQNRAALATYAGSEGGPNHVAAGLGGGPYEDGAQTCRQPLLTKAIAATSESHTGFRNGAEELAIGEIVRFRITFEVPRGTWPAAFLRDLQPPGLRLLQGTSRIALVASQPGGLSSGALGGPGLFVAGSEATVAGVVPTFIPPPGVDRSTPQGLDLALGDLANVEHDCDREFIVVELNALVENSQRNQNGVELENRAAAEATGLALTSNRVRLRLVEPLLRVAVGCPEGRAAPIRIVNRGSTDAFDIDLVDDVPIHFCDDPPVIAVTPPTGAMITRVGQQIEVHIQRIPAGGVVDISSGALCAGIVPDQCHVDLADLHYTSLPGPAGTLINPTGSPVPGASGAANGERKGDGGTVNIYHDLGACNLPDTCSADLSIAKTCSPGPPLTCSLRVTNRGPAAAGGQIGILPFATSNFTVEDVLPPGTHLAQATGDGWTCQDEGTTVSCRYDDPASLALAPGEQAPDLLLQISPDAAPPGRNCAKVDLEPPAFDSFSANNFDCAGPCPDPSTAQYLSQTLEECAAVGPADCPGRTVFRSHCGCGCLTQLPPDLKLIKSCVSDCTLMVENVGVGPAVGTITVTDTLPSGVTLLGEPFAPDWKCEVAGAEPVTVTCTHEGEPLLPGERVSNIHLPVTTAGGPPPQNCARVTLVGDANPGNDVGCSP